MEIATNIQIQGKCNIHSISGKQLRAFIFREIAANIHIQGNSNKYSNSGKRQHTFKFREMATNIHIQGNSNKHLQLSGLISLQLLSVILASVDVLRVRGIYHRAQTKIWKPSTKTQNFPLTPPKSATYIVDAVTDCSQGNNFCTNVWY